jgi:hypothetical protein
MNEAVLVQLASKGGSVGVWTLVFIALITLIKGWPALKKMSIEADGSLRKDLLDRIGSLEAEIRSERKACDERLNEQEIRHVEAMALLKGEVNGLRRQLLQMQELTGQPIVLHDLGKKQ